MGRGRRGRGGGIGIAAGLLLAALAAAPGPAAAVRAVEPEPPVSRVKVVKSERRLYLLGERGVLRSYPVALGTRPVGPKEHEGDRRTPEGAYVLDWKKADSAYYRAIHVSYPSAADRERARARALRPGGAIMIHGQPNGWRGPAPRAGDWTFGCIALANEHMDELWRRVAPGTPIEILP